MENIVLGLYLEPGYHSFFEISIYLLIYGCLTMALGKQIEYRLAGRKYSYLIRYGSRRKWWCYSSLKTIMAAVALITCLFGVLYIVEKHTLKIIDDHSWLYAYLLWMISFVALGMFQQIVINMQSGKKVCFLVVMVLETLSVNMPYFPGNYLMLRRSNILSVDGFDLPKVMLLNVVFIIIVITFGHIVTYERGGKKRGIHY